MSDPADLLSVPAVRATLGAFLREEHDPQSAAYGSTLRDLTDAVRETSPQPDYLTVATWRRETLDDVDALCALARERGWTGD